MLVWADLLACDHCLLWLILQQTHKMETFINLSLASSAFDSKMDPGCMIHLRVWHWEMWEMLNSSATSYRLDNKQSKTTEAETGSTKSLTVQESGSSSRLCGQAFRENPATIVTCAIKHMHWRLALTERSLLLAERPKRLGSPHMPADRFCQRQCADKACLVLSHHCGHARTRKAEDAVQQSHYLALVLLVGATEEELHRASSSTFVHYDCRLICKYFDLISKQRCV